MAAKTKKGKIKKGRRAVPDRDDPKEFKMRKVKKKKKA